MSHIKAAPDPRPLPMTCATIYANDFNHNPTIDFGCAGQVRDKKIARISPGIMY